MKLIAFLFRYSKRIRYARVTISLIILTGVMSGIGSTILIGVINSALNNQGQSSANLVRVFIVFCIVVPVARFVSQTMLERLTSRAATSLRLDLCRRILSSPLRRLEELGQHNLLATLTDDVSAITSALSTIPLLCMNSAIVVACLIYLGWVSWPLLLGVGVFMGLALAIYQLMLSRAARYLWLGRDAWGSLLGHFRALTEGAKELKLHDRRRGAFFSEAVNPTAESLRRFYIAGSTLHAAAGSMGQTVFFALVGLVIFVLPSAGHAHAGVLTSFTLTMLYVIGPLDAITQSVIGLGRSKVALQKVENLGLSLTSECAGRDSAVTPGQPLRNIGLKGVAYAYRSEESQHSFTLGPIDLALNVGEVVFLVGGNGSGKTTLLKLLTGLYIPDAGELSFNGQTVDDENRGRFRQYFSTVFSDYYLFESLFGIDVPELDVQVRGYLERLQLDHKVQVKGALLSTTRLSQGQRKRLALLTAYLEDRPVYIFDEWAADQDPRFKKIFYLELLPELKARGKLVIVISHDDRYYHMADRILKLENGRVEYDEQVNGASVTLREDFPGGVRRDEVATCN